MEKRTLPAIGIALALSLATQALCAPPPAGSLEALQAANNASQPAKPTFFQKMGSSFKQGTDKMAAPFKPKPSVSRAAANDPVALSSKPAKPGIDLYISMAEAAERVGNVAEAEKQYQSALRQSPHDLQVLLSYAHALDRQGKFEQATGVYKHAAEKHPKESAVFNDLGLCYHRRQMLREATVALGRAIELQADRKLYRNNLAAVLVDMGSYDEVLMQLMMAHGDAVAHYNLGFMLVKKGNNQLALHQFQEAAHADPTMSSAQQWVAKLTPASNAPPVNTPMPNSQPPEFIARRPERTPPPIVQLPPTVQPPTTVQQQPEYAAPEPQPSAAPPARPFKASAAPAASDPIASSPRPAVRAYSVRYPQNTPARDVEVLSASAPPVPKPTGDIQMREVVLESQPITAVSPPVARIRVSTDRDEETP